MRVCVCVCSRPFFFFFFFFLSSSPFFLFLRTFLFGKRLLWVKLCNLANVSGVGGVLLVLLQTLTSVCWTCGRLEFAQPKQQPFSSPSLHLFASPHSPHLFSHLLDRSKAHLVQRKKEGSGRGARRTKVEKDGNHCKAPRLKEKETFHPGWL